MSKTEQEVDSGNGERALRASFELLDPVMPEAGVSPEAPWSNIIVPFLNCSELDFYKRSNTCFLISNYLDMYTSCYEQQ